MSLISRLHGAQCTPLRQQLRRSDGVRGVFTQKPLQRGELILSLPLRYCHVTQLGADAAHPPGWFSTADGARELRRWNRGVALLPETWTWLGRFSSDAPADRVSLTSYISADGAAAPSSSGDLNNPAAPTTPAVCSLTLSPVEAALAAAVALRYFYACALHLSAATRTSKRIGPPPCELSDRFVANLPLDLYLEAGVEAVYGDSGASGEAHACLEQLAQNIRDAILANANNEEYRFLDEFPSLFDNLLLVSLYVVRSRVLTVPLLGRRVDRGGNEKRCGVFAPLLDGLNHQGTSPSAAVVVSLQRERLVVRATRDLRRGEEVTLNYRAMQPFSFSSSLSSAHEMAMEEDYVSRYLIVDSNLREGSP